MLNFTAVCICLEYYCVRACCWTAGVRLIVVTCFLCLQGGRINLRTVLRYAVGSRRLMPLDALQPKAYCTNPGL